MNFDPLHASVDAQLARLDALVVRAAAHPDAARLFAARLAPDMLPFSTQVEITANFALRLLFPLAGLPMPAYGKFPATFDGLRTRIAAVRTAIAPLRGDTCTPAPITFEAGDAPHTLTPEAFALQFALPNLHFHFAIAYAIARAHGVALGKADVDGLHRYRTAAP